MQTDETKLATELLHELKLSAKRWFLAFIAMVIVEVLTIAGFLWYISLPVEEYGYNEQVMDNVDTDGGVSQTITDGGTE